MKRSLGAVAGLGLSLLACGPALAQNAEGEELTIYSGVFTEDQVARGKTAYFASCSVCHGPTGQGGPDAPGVIGYVLDDKYEGAPVAAYVDYMRMMMPLGRPGSLSRSTYVDIAAFLLASHGAPAGDVELPADDDALAQIMITKAPE